MAEENSGSDDDAPMSLRDKLLMLGVLGFIAVVAGFVVFDAFEDVRLQRYAHEHYMPVEAKVLESEVRTRTSNRAGTGSGARTSYHPHIRYRYVIDGKGYRSKRYSYSYTFHNTRGFVEEVVAAHPVGARVTAYYDPDKPVKAVLDNSPPDATYFILFMVLFGAVYVFIAGVALRQMFPKQKAL